MHQQPMFPVWAKKFENKKGGKRLSPCSLGVWTPPGSISWLLLMTFISGALKGENSAWEEDGIRCADYGMRQFRMSWDERGVESLSEGCSSSLGDWSPYAPFQGPQQRTELCWCYPTGGSPGDILGSSSSASEGGDSEVTEQNFTSREFQRGCPW